MERLGVSLGKAVLTMNEIESNLNAEEPKESKEQKKPKKEENYKFLGHEKEQLDKMYEHYLQNHEAGTTKDQKSLSDTQKIRFIEDVLAIKFGAEFTSETVPAYYALDLVQFGVQNKNPDAIRLGERILSQQG